MKLKTQQILIVMVFTISISLRIFFLDADPPVPIPADSAFFTDQGWFSHNALNKIQTGSWFFAEDRNEITHTPLYSYIQYLSFKYIGVSLAASRIQSFLFGLLIIIVFAYYIIRNVDLTSGLVFTTLTLLSFKQISYSSATLVESTTVFFSAGSILCLLNFKKNQNYTYLILAGIMTFLAAISKTNGIYVGFAIMLIFLSELYIAGRGKEKYRVIYDALIYISTLGILIFLLYLIWIQPHFSYWKAFNTHLDRLPDSYSFYSIMRYFKYAAYWLYQATAGYPVLMAIFLVAMPYWLKKYKEKIKSDSWEAKLGIYSAIWIFAHFIFFTLARYTEARAMYFLFIPLTINAVLVFKNYQDILMEYQIKKWMAWIAVVSTEILIAFLVYYKFTIQKSQADPILYILLVLGLILIIPIAALYIKPEKNKKYISMIFMVYLVFNMVFLSNWVASKTYSIKEIGSSIKEYVRRYGDSSRSYVFGGLAPTFALEGNFLSVAAFMYGKIEQSYEYYQPDFLLIDDINFEKLIGENRIDKILIEKLDRFDYQVYPSYSNIKTKYSLSLYKIHKIYPK